jgi:DNA-directed RNA polymerase subunit RPC12/RpoP
MEEKIKYKCLKCKFSFRLASHVTKRCPNCGSDTIEEVKADSNEAQRIIENSERW